MEVKEVLFMNQGDGENSYAKNAIVTQRVMELSKPAIEKAVAEYLFGEGNIANHKLLNVVDLGCGPGPVSFPVMSSIIETVRTKCEELNCEVPEFQFYLNDLPGNDFNTLFNGVSGFAETYINKNVSSFVMGAPGSFYGRLFPSNTVHLGYSFYAVHWLSEVPGLRDESGLPMNKGKLYISNTSPGAVKEAYLAQFQKDFRLFLKSRSREMLPNGRLVLSVLESPTVADFPRECSFPWESLTDAIAALVSQGVIEEDKLDSFNVPTYFPSQEEVACEVKKEGSFEMERLETFLFQLCDKNALDGAEKLAKSLMSFAESMLSHHFGEDVLDKVHDKLLQIMTQHLVTSNYKQNNLVIVLRRHN